MIECRSKRNFSLPRQASTSGAEKVSSRSSNRDHPKLKQKGTQTETYDELFMSDDSMTSNEDTGTSKQSSNTLFSSNTLIDNNSDDWAYDSVKANAGSNTLEHITASSRANRPNAYKKPPKRRKSLPSQCSTNDEPHTVTLIPRGPLICSNLENLESWLPDRLFASSVSSTSALLKENSGCTAPPNAQNNNSILINDNSKTNESFNTSIDINSEGACKRGMNSNSASISLNSNSDSSNANNAEIYSSSNSTASSVTAGCADSGEKSSIQSLPVQNCVTAIKILTDLSELDAAAGKKNKTQSLSSSKFMSIKPPRLVITNTNTNTTISSSLCSNPFVIEENASVCVDKSGSESFYKNKTNNINIAGYTGLNYNSSRYSQTSNLGSGSMVGSSFSANNRSRYSKISNLKKNSSSTSTSTTSLTAKPVEASFKQAKLESSVDKKIPISMNRNRIESDCDLNFIIEAGQNDHLNESIYSSNDEDNDVFIKYKLKEAEQVFFVFDYF